MSATHTEQVNTARWGARLVTPDGTTVDEVSLSNTPNPSRPGDPARHGDQPGQYLRVTKAAAVPGKPGTTWYAPTVDELRERAASAEGFPFTELRPVPTHVVVDAWGGVTSADADGRPFGRDDAIEHATKANAAMKPAYDRAHRVYALAEIPIDFAKHGEASN